MEGPCPGTAPSPAGLAAARSALSERVGLRRGVGRPFGFPRGRTVYAAGRGAERSWTHEREVVMKNKTCANVGGRERLAGEFVLCYAFLIETVFQ